MKSKIFTLACLLAASFLCPLSSQNFDVYVSDAGNFNLPPWQILKFDQNGENGVVFISNHLNWPQDILFLEAENTVLITNLGSNVISKFDASTGVFIEEFATGISGPTRMEIGPDSLLYALQWQGNGKVKRYQLDGTFVDDFTATGVSNSIGLAWDTTGNLYVSSYNGNYVKKFSPTGADLGNFISSGLNGPTNIWFGENGDFFVNNWNNGTVLRFDSMGNPLGNFITGIGQCEGIDFFPNGDLAIGAGLAHTVKVYKADGTFVKNLFPPSTLNLLTPNAVVFREKSLSPTLEIAEKIEFVTPTVGSVFQISNPDELRRPLTCEVFDSTGILVEQIHFSENGTWDAALFPTGMYFLSVKLADGKIARQKVVVN